MITCFTRSFIYYRPFMLVIIAAAVAKHSITRSPCVVNEESRLNAAVFSPRLNRDCVITASVICLLLDRMDLFACAGLGVYVLLPAKVFMWSGEVSVVGHGV